VAFVATENAGGSGVQDITYSSSGAQVTPPATVAGASASVAITVEGETVVTYYSRDITANIETAKSLTVRIDETAPGVVVTSPANGGSYLLNSAITANYACSDGVSGVTQCSGTVANGSTIDTSTVGTKSFTVTAVDNAGNTTIRTVNYTVYPPQLTALSPAQIWLGLKNSDDVGTKFDLLAEVYRNGALIGSGQTNDVPGGGSGFNNAVLRTINLGLPSAVGILPGDSLSIRLSVRIAASSGHRSGSARLWYNDTTANSGFGGTIQGVSNLFYLRNGFALGGTPGAGPRSTMDVSVDRNVNGNAFKPFGMWTYIF